MKRDGKNSSYWGTVSGRELSGYLARAVAGAALLLAAGWAGAGVDGYYRYPSIRGDKVIFTSEGDLWSVSVAAAGTAGGTANGAAGGGAGALATRITSHPANEVLPKISPDGKWVAFTADYEGIGNAYVMPVDGGEPKRMTFMANTVVSGWTADSSAILFRTRPTGRDSEEFLYSLPLSGGEPEKLPLGTASVVSYSPDGKLAAFNRWLYTPAWKNYRGGSANQIWVADLAARTFKHLTPVEGINANPMWIGDRIFFIAPTPRDKGGVINLWSMDAQGGDVKQATDFQDYDIRSPETDGKSIVFSHGADLILFDVASGQWRKLAIQLSSDRIRTRSRVEDAAKTLDGYSLSQDGKHIAVSSRGQIWATSTKDQDRRVIGVATDPAARERSPSYSPDSKKIVAITDATGEQELAIYDAAGKAKLKVLTHNNKGWIFDPTWSPDSKHIAYADLTMSLYVVDAETGASEVADVSENAEIREYAFSPDGQYLAYSKQGENTFSEVWIYSLATKEKHRVSTGFTSDGSPAWDVGGKYLYFVSARFFNPLEDWTVDYDFIVNQTQKICVTLLAKETRSPLISDETTDEEAEKGGKKGRKPSSQPATEPTTAPTSSPTSAPASAASTGPATARSSSTKPADLTPTHVDLDGIELRVIELPIPAGEYFGLGSVEGKVIYMQGHQGGMLTPGSGEASLKEFDLKRKRSEDILDGVHGYALSGDSKVMAVHKGQQILVGSPGPGIGGTEDKVNVSRFPLLVDTRAEWAQIFMDAWRLQRDFYFAANMGGVDWNAMKYKYEQLLPRIGHRVELNDLINQLQGELGTSHEYISGGDFNYRPPNPIFTGVLGADVVIDKATGLHRIERIYRPEAWEGDIEAPLGATYLKVEDGDYLIAINGQELAATDAVGEKLQNLAGVEVQLTVASKPDKSDAHDIVVKTLYSDFNLRYRDWSRRNREYVDKQSHGLIGYFHVPDMGAAGLSRFAAGFFPQYKKQALIIDDRDNHGGNVSQLMIERLARTHVSYMRPRRGAMEDYPARASDAYKCVLINQHAGSDGDIFPNAFKTLNLGPLIGTRTWGGVIGIRSDKPFIDGGMSTQPEYAWWSPTRGWAIENHGVDPDIEVYYTPEDYLASKDPQLDRAIAEMMSKITAKPVPPVARPADPDHPGGK